MVVATRCRLWALWSTLLTVWSRSKADGRVGCIIGDREAGGAAVQLWPGPP